MNICDIRIIGFLGMFFTLLTSGNVFRQKICYTFELDSVINSIPIDSLKDEVYEKELERRQVEYDSLQDEFYSFYGTGCSHKKYDSLELIVIQKELEVLQELITDTHAQARVIIKEYETLKREKAEQIVIRMTKLYKREKEITEVISPDYLYVEECLQRMDITDELIVFINENP